MPRSIGGMGIMDTKIMNVCLMAKWIWKIYAGEQGLWPDHIHNKYLGVKDLLVDSHPSGSQFLNAFQKIKKRYSAWRQNT
jgi:hypothetical protein